MGLLDFVKDIGHSLFSSGDEKAADKIKDHILSDNPGIDPLEVKYQDGFVTLGGGSQTWEAVEKAILMAGNVKGVGRVVSEIQVSEAAGNAPGELGGAGSDALVARHYGMSTGEFVVLHFSKDSEQPRLVAIEAHQALDD